MKEHQEDGIYEGLVDRTEDAENAEAIASLKGSRDLLHPLIQSSQTPSELWAFLKGFSELKVNGDEVDRIKTSKKFLPLVKKIFSTILIDSELLAAQQLKIALKKGNYFIVRSPKLTEVIDETIEQKLIEFYSQEETKDFAKLSKLEDLRNRLV